VLKPTEKAILENTSLTVTEKADCATGKLNPVSSPVKFVYIAFGVFFFGLGAIGTVLPLIPTTPLIILSAVCFGKSSRKLYQWCVSTKFYQNNVDGFVKKREMTVKAKVFLLSSITAVMGISFIAMILFFAPVVAKFLLFVVWLCHILFFGIIIKTKR